MKGGEENMKVQSQTIFAYNGLRLWEDDFQGLMEFALDELDSKVEALGHRPCGKPQGWIVEAQSEQPVKLLVVEVEVISKDRLEEGNKIKAEVWEKFNDKQDW